MITFYIITSTLFLASLVALFFCHTIIKRQFVKIEALEEAATAYENRLDEVNAMLTDYETWIVNRRKAVAELHERLVEVDSRKLFEKDDDVGFVFSEMHRLVTEFNDGMK